MDTLDSIYEEKVVNRKNIDSDNKELLDEKREAFYKFFKSLGTLVIVVFVWLTLIYNIYSSINSIGASGTQIGSQLFALILSIVLGIIIPVGYYKVYSGSKKKDPTQVDSGFSWLAMYFKILRILLIIFAVGTGILLLLGLFVSIKIFSAVIICALIYWLAFYVIKIFTEFIDQLKITFNSGYALVPSAKKIRTYLIVVLALVILTTIIVAVVYQNLDIEGFLTTYAPAGSLVDFDIPLILSGLDTIMIYFFIAMGLAIIFQGYFIYYMTQFDTTFTTFNTYYEKKIEEVKRNIENPDGL